MTCPVCGGRVIVIDSRPSEDSIYRRRRCIECDYRFSTIEIEADIYARKEEAVRKANKTAIDRTLQANKEQLYLAFGLSEGGD